MNTDERTRWKQLEVARRRPLGQAAHPDDCFRLTAKGVDWALPRRGVRIVPKFGDNGKVALDVQGKRDWPDAARLVKCVRWLKQDRRCAECGRAIESAIDASIRDAGVSFLEAAAELAAKALRTQYDLSDAELSELLAFDLPHWPEWSVQIIRWAMGLDTQAPVAPVAPEAKPRRQATRRRPI